MILSKGGEKVKFNYYIYLSKEIKDHLRIRDYIKDFMNNRGGCKEEAVYDFLTGNCAGYSLKVSISKEVFRQLEEEVLTYFHLDLLELSYIDYQHYHIVRYDENTNEEIHAATAYHVEEGIWEFYYDQGIWLNSLDSVIGTLQDEGIFLFKIQVSSNDNIANVLDECFDEWVLMQKNRIE